MEEIVEIWVKLPLYAKVEFIVSITTIAGILIASGIAIYTLMINNKHKKKLARALRTRMLAEVQRLVKSFDDKLTVGQEKKWKKSDQIILAQSDPSLFESIKELSRDLAYFDDVEADCLREIIVLHFQGCFDYNFKQVLFEFIDPIKKKAEQLQNQLQKNIDD